MSGISSKEAAALCGGLHRGEVVPAAPRHWRCDSREICRGDAFCAIKGATTDGHLFLLQAVERGATLLLVEKSEADKTDWNRPEFEGVTVIAADNTQEALSRIAQAYLQKVSPHVIAITGSVGKTTVRELTTAALSKHCKVHSAIRSFNTIIGCSLTVLAMAEETDALVLELGTNHFGEISEMVKRFPPETAVITEAVPAHLEGFGSVEGVMKAKSEICESAALSEIIYNNDNKLIKDFMAAHCADIRKIPVGRSTGSELSILNSWVELGATGPKTSARYADEKGEYTFTCSLFGLQHAANMAYAYAAASTLGVTPEEASAAFAGMPPISGRGLCRRCSVTGWLIDEAYNANPASMSAAIKNTRAAAARLEMQKIAVLGGMKELGFSSKNWHQTILAETADFNEVLLLGSEWGFAEENLPLNAKLCGSIAEIIEDLSGRDLSRSILLIKGSNSYGLKRVAESLSEE